MFRKDKQSVKTDASPEDPKTTQLLSVLGEFRALTSYRPAEESKSHDEGNEPYFDETRLLGLSVDEREELKSRLWKVVIANNFIGTEAQEAIIFKHKIDDVGDKLK